MSGSALSSEFSDSQFKVARRNQFLEILSDHWSGWHISQTHASSRIFICMCKIRVILLFVWIEAIISQMLNINACDSVSHAGESSIKKRAKAKSELHQVFWSLSLCHMTGCFLKKLYKIWLLPVITIKYFEFQYKVLDKRNCYSFELTEDVHCI